MGGGGKGGKGGGGGISVQPSPYEQQLAKISKDLYGKTDPLRNVFLQDWMTFLRPPGYSPMGYNAGDGGGNAGGGGNAMAGYYGNWYPGQMIDQKLTPGAQQLMEHFGSSYPQDLAAIPKEQWFIGPNGQIVGGAGVQQQKIGDDVVFFMPSSDPTLQGGAPPGYMQLQPYKMNYGGGGGGGEGGGGGNAAASMAYRQYNPYMLPGYAPIYDLSRQGLESQFNVAKQNIAGSMARGGIQNDALRALEQARAVEVGSLPAQIASGLIQDIMNKAYGAVWNAPSQSISGLSAANTGYSSRSNAALQASMQQQQGKSSGLGMLGLGIGSMLGGFGGIGSMLGSALGGAGTTGGSLFGISNAYNPVAWW